ncbi:hypothetical protein Btru_070552 [Bulinus truncatus]|nr:hypothetical protein Btru_070552 [Bulinus truncatus]
MLLFDSGFEEDHWFMYISKMALLSSSQHYPTSAVMLTTDSNSLRIYRSADEGHRSFGRYLLFLPKANYSLKMNNGYVTFDNNGNISCLDEDFTMTYTADFEDLDGFWRHCMGQIYFFVSLGIFGVIIVCLIVAFILAKHIVRFKSYLFQQVTGYKTKTRDEYETGLFICCQEDEDLFRFAREVLRPHFSRHMTTELEETCDDPGKDRVKGTLQKINASWRVILLFDRGFEEDHWFMYISKMALLSSSQHYPTSAVMLTTDSNVNRIPSHWLSLIPEDNIITVKNWKTYDFPYIKFENLFMK